MAHAARVLALVEPDVSPEVPPALAESWAAGEGPHVPRAGLARAPVPEHEHPVPEHTWTRAHLEHR